MSAALAAPFALVDLGTVASTNDEALARARAGAPSWTVVRAVAQSAGRGRRGRRFFSPPGNSFTSFVLRPRGPSARVAELALVAGLAVAEAIESVAPDLPRPLCKWPNDVLVAGRKVCGVLVEAASNGGLVDHAAVGIGINLVRHPGLAGLAGEGGGDLASLGARGVDRDSILAPLAQRLKARFEHWQARGFAALRGDWLARAAGLGGRVAVDDGRGGIEGRLVTVDDDGALVVMDDGGRRHRILSGSLAMAAA